MPARIDREELRQLIREALKEALGLVPPPPLPTGEGDHARHGGGDNHKRLASPLPPPPRSAVPLPRFAGEGPNTAPPRKNEAGVFRFESGVLTEAKVAEIGRSHAKILVGGEAVITPLARDRAREMKLELVRGRP
jgi:hypothetical protein